MGWISHRCFRTGHSINSNPSKQRKGILRKIVGYKYMPTNDFFDRPIVILECGHEVISDGMHRARCDKCQQI